MFSFKDKVTDQISRLFSSSDSPPPPSQSPPLDPPQARPHSEGKSLSSIFTSILPSSSFAGFQSNKHTDDIKPIQSPPVKWKSTSIPWLDKHGYEECDHECENKGTPNSHGAGQEQGTGRSAECENKGADLDSGRSTSSSDTFEDATESIMWRGNGSTIKHGISLRTLIRRSADLAGPCLLIVGDKQGAVFGGLLECPLKPTPKRKYQSTLLTSVKCTLTLEISVNRLTGTSGPCDTFGNLCLAHSQEFELKNVEEDISGLSTAQTLELCDPEVLLFQEPLQNSEDTSTSNCCHEDTSCHFFKTTDKNGTEITAATDGCSLPELIFDNDIYVSKDFALSSFIPPIFPNNYQEDQLSLLDQSQSFSQEAAVVNGLPAYPPDDYFAPIAGPTIIPSLLGERCLSLMPNPYMRLSSFLGSANTVLGPYLPCNLSSTAVLSDDKYSGIFNGSTTDYVGTRVQNQDLKVLQGDHNGGIFSSDPLPGIYGSSGPLPGIYDSSTVLQKAALCNERQHAVKDGGSCTPLDTDVSSLEDSAIKAAAKCSYACRKTLADRRPRVRGRFARNDEFLCMKPLEDLIMATMKRTQMKT
ncbi:hypothetical protein C3L33_12579, partial [Rhododendron williamsianum]